MLQQELKQKDIALAIEKVKSFISCEIHRNCDNRRKKYRADLAQHKYRKRINTKNSK